MTRTILIVDDNTVDRRRAEQLLTDAGFLVSSANDGQQAIQTVRLQRPDLILMDVNMPGMDGFAATRALRGDPSTKDIPVVFVTSKDQKADRAWAQMLGARGHIAKPYTDDQLLAQVRAV